MLAFIRCSSLKLNPQQIQIPDTDPRFFAKCMKYEFDISTSTMEKEEEQNHRAL